MRFDIEDLSRYDDAGEADFIDVFEFKNAEVIDRGFFSKAVCSRSYCCSDKAWWFSNLPLSSSKPKQQFFAEKQPPHWIFTVLSTGVPNDHFFKK